MAPAGPANPESMMSLDFRPETIRGAPGFFHAVQSSGGCWWLRDADARPFFGKVVHGVRAPETVPDTDAAAQLRRWGFNAVGSGSDRLLRIDGFPFLATANVCRVGALIQRLTARLPDVFDPDWSRMAALHAIEVCAPLARERQLIGWITDDDLGWAQSPPATEDSGSPPTLLQICLSLEPGFAAYHAAWEFVLALHGGKLAAVGRAWGLPLANREVVRELTRVERGLAARGYRRDCARWSREFARRYFAGASAAIRAADPNHLVLGARARGPVGESVAAEGVYPAVDVPLLDAGELPLAGKIPPGPVLVDGFCWAERSFSAAVPAAVGRARRLTTVEWMLRRGRLALERMARHPAIVGYAWRQWLDEPGEQPPFARGLVHVNGAEAREHTELLAEFNARADLLRCAANPAEILPS